MDATGPRQPGHGAPGLCGCGRAWGADRWGGSEPRSPAPSSGTGRVWGWWPSPLGCRGGMPRILWPLQLQPLSHSLHSSSGPNPMGREHPIPAPPPVGLILAFISTDLCARSAPQSLNRDSDLQGRCHRSSDALLRSCLWDLGSDVPARSGSVPSGKCFAPCLVWLGGQLGCCVRSPSLAPPGS